MCDYRSETENFTWDRTLILGKGTVRSVFCGRRKSNSEAVAVKSFNTTGNNDRSVTVKLREIDVLSKLNHENIVKVVAVEDELNPATRKPNGRKALVMELCTGGSLATALKKPENYYGLPESEFLLVWEHLTNAMRHLRDLNISHRDLKPGNILIYIRENGRKVYKLADFDTAKELDDGEKFESLVGTVPYLNPQMYQLAIQQLPGKFCSTSVDLWSIGVTLYETATGKLPFRPYNWTDNNAMYQILNKKPSGSISGSQQGANGSIRYSSSLPSSCLLSTGLKVLLTPIIASLCESREESIWNYQKYFNESYAVLRRKRVHILNANTIESLYVYLESKGPDNTPLYSDLRTEIQIQTELQPDSQLLFYKNTPLLSFLDSGMNIRPIQTTEETPIILINKETDSILPKLSFNSRKFHQFGNVPNLCTDAGIAAENMKNAHARKREFDIMTSRIQFIHSIVSTVNQYVVAQLIQVTKESDSVENLIQLLINQFKMVGTFVNSCDSLLPPIKSFHNKASSSVILKFASNVTEMKTEVQSAWRDLQAFKINFNNLTPSLHKLTSTRIKDRSLILLWDDLIQYVTDIDNVNEFTKTGSKLMSQLELSYNILKLETNIDVNVEPESITHAREYYRHMERLKMPASYQSFENLAKSLQNLFETILKKFNEWYSNAFFASMQPEILMKNMTVIQSSLTELGQRLNSLIPKFRNQLDSFTLELREVVAREDLKSAARDDMDTFYCPWILKENFLKLKTESGEIQQELMNWNQLLNESTVVLENTLSRLQL